MTSCLKYSIGVGRSFELTRRIGVEILHECLPFVGAFQKQRLGVLRSHALINLASSLDRTLPPPGGLMGMDFSQLEAPIEPLRGDFFQGGLATIFKIFTKNQANRDLPWITFE